MRLRNLIRHLVEDAKKPSLFQLSQMSWEELKDFADGNLHKLGCGTSRCAFRLDSKNVLKVAQNSKGLGQNKAEETLSANEMVSSVVARVNHIGHQGQWLVSDLVRPVTASEFQERMGIEDFDVPHAIAAMMGKDVGYDALGSLTDEGRQTIKLCVGLVKSGVLPQDIRWAKHWGKTRDGRIVILDYGMTADVQDKFYR